MINNANYKILQNLLKDSKNITLITHLNPDGDAVGSLTAMGLFLKAQGKNCTLLTPNKFPGFLKWMPSADEIIIAEKNTEQAHNALMESDLLICLDFNTLHRTGKFEDSINQFTGKKVLIDHHLDPDDLFDLVMVDTSASSASEIVFDIISYLDPDYRYLSKDIAVGLYVGIMTDTGSFNYSSNRPELYPKIGSLVKAGADPELLHTLIYSTNTENRVRLLGFCLYNRLVIHKKYRTAYIYLTKNDLQRFHFRVGDTEGIVNYTLSLDGINLGVLFTERNGHVKLSLRSKGAFSVNDFARNHFTGGGHKNASGAESKMELTDTIKMFEELLPLYEDQLNTDVEY